MIISLSGKGGSGKSTVAKLLAEKLGYQVSSIGDIKRELAEKMGLSIGEFNKLGDQPGKEQEFDIKYEDMRKSFDVNDNIVLVGRTGFYCQPKSFKVFLTVSDEEAARRIVEDHRATDKFESIEQAMKMTEERDKIDKERYQKLYGIDYLNTNNYDLIIETDNLTVEKTTDKIIPAFQNFQKSKQ